MTSSKFVKNVNAHTMVTPQHYESVARSVKMEFMHDPHQPPSTAKTNSGLQKVRISNMPREILTGQHSKTRNRIPKHRQKCVVTTSISTNTTAT